MPDVADGPWTEAALYDTDLEINDDLPSFLDDSRRASAQDLPEEILMRIISLACSRHPYCERIFREMNIFSHVSRHFRSAALGMSEMWAFMSPRKMVNQDLAEMLLARSKSADMHIHFYPDFYTYPHPYWNDQELIRAFLEKVIPLAHRWRDLYFHPYRYNDIQHTDLWDLFNGIELPRLEFLEYDQKIGFGEGSVARNDTNPIYSSWRFWKLQEIRTNKPVPVALWGSSLSIVHMEFAEHGRFITLLTGFYSFLQSTPTVEALFLTEMSLHEAERFSGPAQFRFEKLELDRIHTIELTGEYVDDRSPEERNYDGFCLCRFMQSLVTPKLRRLKIHMLLLLSTESPTKPMDNISNLIVSLTSASQPSPVQELDLDIRGQTAENPYKCNSLIAVPFDRFPALRSLSVFISGILGPPRILPDNSPSSAFPSLERIRVAKSWGGAVPFLRNILSNLKTCKGQAWKASVSVAWCVYVKKENLLEFIAPEDLEFNEYDYRDKETDTAWYGYIPDPSDLPSLLASIGFEG